MEQLEVESWVGLEEDVIESLSGEAAVAVLPGDIRTGGAGLGGTVEALLLAGVSDERELGRALRLLSGWLEDQGVEVDDGSIVEYETVSEGVSKAPFPEKMRGFSDSNKVGLQQERPHPNPLPEGEGTSETPSQSLWSNSGMSCWRGTTLVPDG